MEQWDSVRIGPFVQPAVALTLQRSQSPLPLYTSGVGHSQQQLGLDGLQPCHQAGPYAWAAPFCCWKAEQLQLVMSQKQPDMVFGLQQGSGRQELRALADLNWLLRQPAAVIDERTAGPAADGSPFCNTLLLHVAGRHCDTSIYLLLVPRAASDAVCGLVFWAYALLLDPFSIEDRLQMHQQPSRALLQAEAVLATSRSVRLQERQWAACVEYQRSYGRQPSGLPQWLKNVGMQPHLLAADPAGQLDIVDRCYLHRSDCGSAAGSSAGSGGSAAAAAAGREDACSSSQAPHALAGCVRLQPLSVGPWDDFIQPCSCPSELWCQGQQARQQLLQLWRHEQAPALAIRPSSRERGLGLFAAQQLQSGVTIGEYCGELLSEQETRRREKLYHAMGEAPLLYLWKEERRPPSLALSLEQERLAQQAVAQQQQQQQQWHGVSSKRGSSGGGSGRPAKAAARAVEVMAIDATFLGGVTRFMNHHCEPNCAAVTVCCGRKAQEEIEGSPGDAVRCVVLVLIQTTRDVQEGEELTFNYSATSKWEERRQEQAGGKTQGLIRCTCGAHKCSGFVFRYR